MISTKKRTSTRPTHPKTVAEVYVGWVPRTMGVHRHERHTKHWRWDVTFHRTSATRGGVYDVRDHLGADFGYTLTEWGAWWQVRQAIRRYPRQVG